MPNTNTPKGLIPARGVNNQYVSGGLRTYSHKASDSTALFIGDPVKLAGTSSTINGISTPDVVRAATGDVLCGVVVGMVAATRDTPLYGAASTAYQLYVDDDPNTLFEIQDINSGTALTADDVGLNINFVAGSGSTATGFSGFTIDNTTEATTNTLDLKIVDIVNRADNDITGVAAAKYLVRMNRHQYVNQVAGV